MPSNLSREMRIFVSSTFNGMENERTLLMTRMFPKLIKIASERGVILIPIDLRWGITTDKRDEVFSKTKIIDACLKEIKTAQCFIGILGERYGWCPGIKELSKSKMLKGNYPDLVKSGMSMTELEMQYGVFLHPKHRITSFFIKENDSRDPQISALVALKEKIVQGETRLGYTVYNYSSFEQFAQQILSFVLCALDTLFPEKHLSEHKKNVENQQYLLEKYIWNYIPNENNLFEINKGINKSQYFCVTGLEGMGKTALLANWIESFPQNDNTHIVFHLSSTNTNNDYHHILQYLCHQITDIYKQPFDEKQADNPNSYLQTLLKRVPPKDTLILVLDGVDEQWVSLRQWSHLPSNVKLLYSSHLLDDNSIWAGELNYPSILIDEMSEEEKLSFIHSYLNKFGKELKQVHEEHLARVFTGNILMLRSLLDLLIIFGNNNTIERIIDNFTLTEEKFYYLEQNDDLKFSDKHEAKKFHEEHRFYLALIDLYVKEFPEIPVMHILSTLQLISLKESEIPSFIHLPYLLWSYFKTSFGPFLTHTQEGYIKINNPDLAYAIKYLMIGNIEFELDVYKRAIDFFSKENTIRLHTARIQYLLCKKEYSQLFETLCDKSLFKCLYSYNRKQLSYYWNEVITNIPNEKPLCEYARQFTGEQDYNDEHITFLSDFSHFCLNMMGNGDAAQLVANYALSICEIRKGKDHELTLRISRTVAMSHMLMGNYEKAIQIIDDTIGIYKSKNSLNQDLAICYCCKGMCQSLLFHYEDGLLNIHHAKEIIIKTNGDSSKMMATCYFFEGISYLLQKDKRAIISLERAQIIMYNNYGGSGIFQGDIALAISYYFYQVGKYAEAYNYAWYNSMSEYTGVLHENNFRFAIGYLIGSIILYHTNEYQDAKDYRERADEIQKKNDMTTPLLKVIETALDCHN